jgi:hypothetical protein
MIYYKKGYKYQLTTSYQVHVSIYPEKPIDTDYIKLSMNGILIIAKGYAWDGPSGPAIDTKNFMRGSLVHDALYQLMRLEHLDRDYRQLADRILQRLCKEDGMSSIRAWIVYQSVRLFGDPSADPANKKPVINAP